MRVLLSFFLFTSLLRADLSAPGAPGKPGNWASAKKQGFGTSLGTSRVWFTIADGILTEVYFPRIDRAQTRETQLLISDGKSFLSQEKKDTLHEVKRVGDSPFYRIVNTDPEHRFVIEKEIWVDSTKEILFQKIRVTRNIGGLNFYLFHKPAAANSIFGDSAYAKTFIAGQATGFGAAWHGIKPSCGFVHTSADFYGEKAGFDPRYSMAENGNVMLTGLLNLTDTPGTSEFTLALHFNENKQKLEQEMLKEPSINLSKSSQRFQEEWAHYVSQLDLPVTHSNFREKLVQSALVLKAAEDKTYRGSIIASPSHPWGESQFEPGPDPWDNAGYHAVWPRDLYQIVYALIALGDKTTAVQSLESLKRAQFKDPNEYWNYPPRRFPKKGSFPQNYWVDGAPLYGGYQVDETAMPVLLAYRLWKLGWIGTGDSWDMVRDAADFLSTAGPWTHEERWEETYGISPNSAAYVISALVAASELAEANKRNDLKDKYLWLADAWAGEPGKNIDAWTFTTNGKLKELGSGNRYYLRLAGGIYDENDASPIHDAIWDPNTEEKTLLANIVGEDPFRYQSEIIDGGFLSLVRLGVRAALHPNIIETLPVIDRFIKTDTPFGPGWHRYRLDRYGENFKGRIWPLLTGERAHYELQALKENGQSVSIEKLRAYVDTYASFSNSQDLFSEQVWDEGGVAGTPTGSATPLLWSHAEFVTMNRSILEGRPFDEVESVRKRYGKR